MFLKYWCFTVRNLKNTSVSKKDCNINQTFICFVRLWTVTTTSFLKWDLVCKSVGTLKNINIYLAWFWYVEMGTFEWWYIVCRSKINSVPWKRTNAFNYLLSPLSVRFVNILKLEFFIGISSVHLLKTICHMPRCAGKLLKQL